MKNIFYIFFRDVRSIVKNWALLVIILGLVFLPSLYAWFNILASWDPYGNTGNISVAVINQDQGAVFKGRSLKIGDEIIASLKKNKNIGWVFTDEEDALRGVNHGDYYASILIPADFSKKISSFLTDVPQKAEIDYTVNEKINAIAPKITAKGASGIVEQVRKNFIHTANGTIFSIFNEIGLELEKERPTIEKVSNLILKLESMMPEVHRVVDEMVQDMAIADRLITKAQSNLALIADEIKGYKEFVNHLSAWLNKGSDVLSETAGPNMKTSLILMKEISAATKQLSDSMMDPAIDPTVVNNAIDRSIKHISNGILVTQSLADLFERMNEITGENRLQYAVNKSKELNAYLTQELTILNQVKGRVSRGEDVSGELAAALNGLATRSETILDDLLSRFDSEIMPQIQNGFARVKFSSDKAAKILQGVSQDIPDVQKVLVDAKRGVTVGNKELLDIQRRLPAIQSKINDLANVIRKLEKEGTLNELIDLLKNNAEREGQFFAEPVILKEHKLFPIPNYGSAMSPFFTTLSLWVGALLLVSLLSVEVHEDQRMFKAYQVYLGRYLTFLLLGIFQSLSITLGDLFILKTYVADKGWFVLFAMLLSSIFMLIVYTFVSVFGNVGKAMAIVLLVLQLAGSGGTFPIQVTPPFFQAIYPLLPFTYAISLMREAVGGILWDVVRHDLLYLSCFVTIMLLLGLTLKDLVNRSTAKFVQKAKEGKLIH
ncbi:YhgE/Pip domain-containing protein [Bacillus sp. S/N-304-OC-R1]|uniref:YhgE/Pip domain-containing protein n=1 Tax=Bacillus sp. S/N-304-OC-R1 TaxID=2758034 RepID=UPI001C8E3C70|nr:YhgE/Pip domain-containing protein [Bacillus sp. S/N-304-OC-R1]MBY0122775.1 YhgE/Pip domain-containing protein [Bacillus sp. S/N-304-OC-R1]